MGLYRTRGITVNLMQRVAQIKHFTSASEVFTMTNRISTSYLRNSKLIATSLHQDYHTQLNCGTRKGVDWGIASDERDPLLTSQAFVGDLCYYWSVSVSITYRNSNISDVQVDVGVICLLREENEITIWSGKLHIEISWHCPEINIVHSVFLLVILKENIWW